MVSQDMKLKDQTKDFITYRSACSIRPVFTLVPLPCSTEVIQSTLGRNCIPCVCVTVEEF